MGHMDTKKYDLTQGGILQRLFLVAAPLMATQFLQMAYNLTDMFWLGRVSSDALASVSTAGMFMWLSMAFLVLGRMGAEIGVSQSMGRADPEAARSFAQNALFLGAVAGISYALFAHLFRHQLIGVFAIREAHVAYDAAMYLGIVALGMPATFLSGAVTGTFNGVGNSRVPFVINGFGLVLNMILTPIMIFTLELGVVGAAWSTVIAQVTVVLIALAVVRFSPIRPFAGLRFFVWPDFKRLKQMFRWTLPISVEAGAFTILSLFIARFVAAFGADALAGFLWAVLSGAATAGADRMEAVQKQTESCILSDQAKASLAKR